MKKLRDGFYRLLEILLVSAMVAMCVMVFTNVVLRYGFNRGLAISEEMARFSFVWLTFIGAVLTFRDNAHMGIETVVQHLSRRGRLVCMLIVNLLIMLCGAIFCWGAWEQLEVNRTMFAPVSGLSLAWIYGIGLFTGTGVFLIAAARVWDIVTGRVSDEEIARFGGDHTIEEITAQAKEAAQ